VQPVSGSAPAPLTSAGGRWGFGYSNAWRLGNGDVLLLEWADCGASQYAILPNGKGAIRPLHEPRGSGLSRLLDEDGDIAVFEQQTRGCGQPGGHFSLIQYNLMTGRTSPLLDGPATVFSWPGDPS
jgi:hypothetical protein